VPSDPGPEHVPDDPPLGALQFTSDEVEGVLQDLDFNKGIRPIILKNCASALTKPQNQKTLLFNRSMALSVFPRWKVSYVTPICKKGRCNNVEDYRGVAILSTIPKPFELLVY
jgi:hypothetical protein